MLSLSFEMEIETALIRYRLNFFLNRQVNGVKNKHLPKEKCCNKSIIPNIGSFIKYIILFL